MMITEYGKSILNDIKENYTMLYPFYDVMMGNFQMTRKEMLDNILDIERFMNNHTEYSLVYQPLEEYEGADWFLIGF